MHIIHKWNKWKDFNRGSLVNGDDVVIGKYIIQEKECSICGKKKMRTIRTY